MASATSVTITTILPGTPKPLAGGWFEVTIPGALLVLTADELKLCLRRGKWWRRHQQLQARLKAAEDPR